MPKEELLEHTRRFVVGIDLGTTNCSLSYVDLAQDGNQIRQLQIPQLVAPGEIASDSLLPSFCYLPGEHELPQDSLKLPWNPEPKLAVGLFAREQGARIPERLVASAKSWLAHPGVDRAKPILPWGGNLGDQMLSPVQVSTHYLTHLLNAWNQTFGNYRDQDGSPCLLQDQQVVVTVPASFDESAREFTIRAARDAGLKHVTLIEEPLAAFYSWLAFNQKTWTSLAQPGDVIVVVDVGGGTTDFSLVEIDQDYTLRRKAVGNHLLLGGDNVDMTLATVAEKAWKTKLPQRLWTRLCQECRRAKETLLAPDAPETYEVKLPALGSSVVSKLRTHTFQREEVRNLILQGFFPAIPVDDPPPTRRQGVQEMGLPYAADPTVTRHLLQFLRTAGPSLATPVPRARPNKVLYNGGALIPRLIREHLTAVMESWNEGQTLQELQPTDFSLAVSQGAAYYGLARRGQGIRVKGGIANAYFLEVSRGQDEQALLCVMPRDTAEGVVCKLPTPFSLQTNTPVAFPLYASSTRLADKLGDIVPPAEDITPLPPLRTVLRFGKKDIAALEVTLEAQLNEIGTLEIACQSTSTPHRFPLTFELRDADKIQAGQPQEPTETVDQNRIDQALDIMRNAFSQDGTGLEHLTATMEKTLDLGRHQWPATLLRKFADELLQLQDRRRLSTQHETRWLNLTGFCLRPGFGVVGDEERIRKLWKLWNQGTTAPTHQPARTNWFILWRRTAAGLTTGQQSQIGGVLARELVAKDLKTVIRKDDPVTLEAWRLLAVLERLPLNLKVRCLTALIKGTGRLDDLAFWPIARLAARELFAGTHDAVIPADRLAPLVSPLLQKTRQSHAPKHAIMALMAMAQLTGIRTSDLKPELRAHIIDLLKESKVPENILQDLNTPSLNKQASQWNDDMLGDSLPLGLQLENNHN